MTALTLAAVVAAPILASAQIEKTMIGPITAIDMAKSTMTVSAGKDNDHFTLQSDVSLVSNGKGIQAKDLKIGERVRVTYTETGGAKVASRVELLPPPRTEKKS